MRDAIRVLSVVSAFVLLSASGGQAQDIVSGTPVSLTLEEAIRSARQNNPQYLTARNNLRLNATNTRNTWANTLLPSVRVNLLSTGAGGNARTTSFDNFGNPIQNPITNWVYNSSSSQNLNFSWSFTGTSLFRAHREMQITNEGREIQVETQTNTVERNVRNQFYAVQQAQFQLALQQTILADLERDLNTTNVRYALGQGNTVQVRQAELAIKQQEQSIAQQRRQLQQSLLTLWTTLGDPDLGPIELVPAPIRVFEPSGIEVESLVLIAQTSSPQARSAENSIESSRMSLTNAKQTAWLPSFSSSFRLGRGVNARDMSGAIFELTDYEGGRDMSFSISLNFPILSNYFQTKNSLTQAEVSFQNAQENHRQTRLDFEQSVRSAYQNLLGQYEAIALAVESRAIAADALRLAREQYALGASSFDALQQSIRADENARRDVINAQYSFINSFTQLETATGVPIPVDEAAYARAVAELGDLSDAGIGLGGPGGN
jgi:outer membrane protein